VSDTPEIHKKLGELDTILEGPGLIKPRHYPVVVQANRMKLIAKMKARAFNKKMNALIHTTHTQ
jgi:hypothetical protein